MDKYQERYLAHQKRKKASFTSNFGTKDFKKHGKNAKFLDVLIGRRSQRIYNSEPITDEELEKVLELAEYRPSSCDRRSVEMEVIRERHDKEILSGLLVGGVGWSNRADTILLMKAWIDAYKSPAEKDFMAYIDAGVLAQTLYLVAESLNIGACYINPNIREENKAFFQERFMGEGWQFCGAMALGKYDRKATRGVRKHD